MSAIPIEVFTSDAGVFIAAPEGCKLFDAVALRISRRTRLLHAAPHQAEAVSGRLPAASITAFEGVTQIPLVAFALGGVVQAALKPIQLED